MRTRDFTQSFKIDATELAKLHRLASEESDRLIGRMLRKWIEERYAARFGDTAPPVAAPTRGRARKGGS